MKLTMQSSTVVCSMENKNSDFLSCCSGAFDGFENGKLKMLYDEPSKYDDAAHAAEWNMWRLKDIIRYASRYKVEVDEAVVEYCEYLERLYCEYDAQKRKKEEEAQKRDKWKRLCANGCKGCDNLAYYVDIPICKITGEALKERNVQEYTDGVLRLFNSVPFPSESCPFNINKNKENKDERISEACASAVEA